MSTEGFFFFFKFEFEGLKFEFLKLNDHFINKVQNLGANKKNEIVLNKTRRSYAVLCDKIN